MSLSKVDVKNSFSYERSFVHKIGNGKEKYYTVKIFGHENFKAQSLSGNVRDDLTKWYSTYVQHFGDEPWFSVLVSSSSQRNPNNHMDLHEPRHRFTSFPKHELVYALHQKKNLCEVVLPQLLKEFQVETTGKEYVKSSTSIVPTFAERICVLNHDIGLVMSLQNYTTDVPNNYFFDLRYVEFNASVAAFPRFGISLPLAIYAQVCDSFDEFVNYITPPVKGIFDEIFDASQTSWTTYSQRLSLDDSDEENGNPEINTQKLRRMLRSREAAD
jgi:hypothetical protein